ncbi:hypothetical protein [Allorhizocola rhizosphaerae]|uniref:hypothetical protein n=1 Tax=Allorhizocola rhizosphaerae TaxID=1872709 RepID=UPI0013C2E675|nr:hypothetical protein [Allorhizocola rhizosphaerae]
MACTVETTICGTVHVTGAGPISYGVFRAGKTPADLVLMEVGGPGANALARTDRQTLGLPTQIDKYDVLLINEPWVSATATRECTRAMTEFTKSVILASTPSAKPIGAQCSLPVWTQDRYTTALKAVLAQLGRPLAGIVGHSYGALPAAAAALAFPHAWLILNAPIATPDTPGSEVMSQRIKSINQELDRSYQSHCAALGLDCGSAGHEIAEKAISTITTVTVPSRANALSKGDFAAAIIGSLYGLGENATWLWTTIAKIASLDEVTRAQVARMADQILMRYGDNQISERLAAFIKGTCNSYQQWPIQRPSGAVLHTFFDHVTYQCGLAAPASSPWDVRNLRARPRNACVYSNLTDPVTPSIWAHKWVEIFGDDVAANTYTHQGHTTLSVALKLTQDNSCALLNGDTR